MKFFNQILLAALMMSASLGAVDPTCTKEWELDGIPKCGHCQAIQGKVDRLCGRHGKKLDASCFHDVIQDGQVCACNCSCVAGDTLIALADGSQVPISDLVEGIQVAAPYANTSTSQIVELTVADSTGFPVRKVTLSNEKSITASLDHIFVRANGDLVTAEKLKNGDVLMGWKDVLIKVLSIEDIHRFKGNLYNLVISPNSSEDKDHLYMTNGILSADFALQIKIEKERAK